MLVQVVVLTCYERVVFGNRFGIVMRSFTLRMGHVQWYVGVERAGALV